MAIIDVVKWDARADELAHKHKETELSTWTQLIVNESQEALLYRGGAMDGPFGPGRHTLKTENIPGITALMKLPFGRSPFTAEVWFVNRSIALDVPWSTEPAIQLMDPLHRILVPVLAEGQYGVQVEHSRKFVVKLVGTMPEFSQAQLRSYLRGMILAIAKSAIAREIVRKRISFLEVSTQLVELSQAIRAALQVELADFGLRLVNFFVSSIHVAENDPSVVRLRDALSRRAEMEIIGYNYQQERSLDVLAAAAANEGASHALMDAGIGLAAGVAAGGAIGRGFGALADSLQTPAAQPVTVPVAASGPTACSGCGADLAPADRFCSECGTPVSPPARSFCSGCGVEIKPSAKFCAACGTPRATTREHQS